MMLPERIRKRKEEEGRGRKRKEEEGRGRKKKRKGKINLYLSLWASPTKDSYS
jgi:hypothetical protein